MNQYFNKTVVWVLFFVLLPIHTIFAQVTIGSLLGNTYIFLATYVIRLAYAAAFLFFLYGIARYIFASADDAKAQGRELIVWGTVAILLLSSIWGIVAILNRTLGTGSPNGQPTGTIRPTCVKTYGGGDCADRI